MRALTLLAVLAALPAAASAQDSFGASPARPREAPPAPRTDSARARPAADPASAAELRDLGVAPRSTLHPGPMHAPTPNSIPGGRVITTREVVALLGDRQSRSLVLDVLGGPETLPGAVAAAPAAQPGGFQDNTQREFGQFLQQATGGNLETPLVLYCLSDHCWMSYNAALRAINLGYRNVLWYRGGLEAWKAAGQDVRRR